MSEFLAEARIVIRPDTTAFAAELAAQLKAITAKPVVIPVTAAVSSTIVSAAASTAGLQVAQQAAEKSTLGLASAADVETSAFGKQATVLNAATVETEGLATAQVAGAAAARKSAEANLLNSTNLIGAQKGIRATALQLIGLRGATLSASGGFLAGAAAAIIFGKSLSLFANFQQQLNVFQATARATADEMERVSATAQALGRDITLPGVSASDAAQTLTELAKAGLSVQEALDAVRGTLQLATAAQIDNASATELVANALNAFRLPGTEAAKVADLLAGASIAAQGSITDMGLALKQSAAVASGFGLTVQDTVTLLTQLARSGISSSDAGTSLRVTLLRLVQDLPKVNAEVKALGLNLEDAQGNIRPEVFGELGRALLKLDPAARKAAVAALGGSDAIRTFILLARDGPAVFEATRREVERSGQAQELAAAQTKGLKGDTEALGNELGQLGLNMGKVAAVAAGPFVVGLTKATAAVNDFTDALDKKGFFKTFGDAVGNLDKAFGQLNIDFRAGVTGAKSGAEAFDEFGAIVRGVAGDVNSLNTALKGAVSSLSAAHPEAGKGLFLGPQEKLDIQGILAGGTDTLSDDIATARAQLAKINAQLDDFHGNRNQFAAKVKEQAQAQANLNRLLNQQAAQNQAAAKASQAAAKSAKAAADASFLNTQALTRQQQENRIAAAELTPGLQDDIKRQQQYVALINAQIVAINKSKLSQDARKQAIAALKAAALAADKALNDLLAQQKKLQQERRDALTDILGQRLQLAELRGNRDAILAALNAAIADARKRVKAAKTLAERLDEQIALQELINRKNDLLGEKMKTGNANAEALFSQLQAQQGFAANLLGNIIPSGKTAGLVGTPSPALRLPPGLGPLGIIPQVGAEAAAADGRAATSPTAGQAQTTNQILRSILRQLQILTRSTEAPEAVIQDRMGRAVMTGGGGNLDVM